VLNCPKFRVRYRIAWHDLLTDALSFVEASVVESRIRANCLADLATGEQRLSVVVDSQTWRGVVEASPPFLLTMEGGPYPLALCLWNVTAAAQADGERQADRDREIERRALRRRRRALALAIVRGLGRTCHQAAAAVRACCAAVRVICS
jgi:hypothetical protein